MKLIIYNLNFLAHQILEQHFELNLALFYTTQDSRKKFSLICNVKGNIIKGHFVRYHINPKRQKVHLITHFLGRLR